ncbi:MAG: DNA gyrase C-terminal beta-propeller domain-containing protein, partial [Pseudomonadota bacterium]
PDLGILITRHGKGFRFDYSILREPAKRVGRRLANLSEGDEVLAVKPADGDIVVVLSDSGRLPAFPVYQVPVLSGAGQGVRMIKLSQGGSVKEMVILRHEDRLLVKYGKSREKVLRARDIPLVVRGAQGKDLFPGIREISCVVLEEETAK